MDTADILEEHDYCNDAIGADYFRHVEMIEESPSRPGNKVVVWNTDGFDVEVNAKGRRPLKRRGKCGIATFAKWASRDITSRK